MHTAMHAICRHISTYQHPTLLQQIQKDAKAVLEDAGPSARCKERDPHLWPVHNIPPSLHVLRTTILALQVVCCTDHQAVKLSCITVIRHRQHTHAPTVQFDTTMQSDNATLTVKAFCLLLKSEGNVSQVGHPCDLGKRRQYMLSMSRTF